MLFHEYQSRRLLKISLLALRDCINKDLDGTTAWKREKTYL